MPSLNGQFCVESEQALWGKLTKRLKNADFPLFFVLLVDANLIRIMNIRPYLVFHCMNIKTFEIVVKTCMPGGIQTHSNNWIKTFSFSKVEIIGMRNSTFRLSAFFRGKWLRDERNRASRKTGRLGLSFIIKQALLFY